MEDGVWRTVGGRRIFIKDGQSLSDAMKKSGKFKLEKKDIKGTLKKQLTEKQRKQKIEELKEKLNEKEFSENKKTYKTSLEKDGKVIYVSKSQSGNLTTNPKDKGGIEIGNEKAQQKYEQFIENFKKKGYKVNEEIDRTEKYKISSFDERDKIEKEIKALENGFNNHEEYIKFKETQKKARINNLKKEYESSYVYKNARKDIEKYNYFYDDNDRESTLYNVGVFSELIKRTAKKELNIEEIHSSAKSGSKFENSIYLKDKDSGNEVRISNHYLPETSEREYKHEKFGTRWDKELVLDQPTMQDIVKIKDEKEFKKFVINLFKN